MSGFSIKVQGLDKALEKLNVKKFNQDISDELNAFGLDVARDAKQLVPVDEGLLKNSIGAETTGLEVTIFASADYAAYVEFGTRKFAAKYVATLPPEWKTYAAQFKGKGGGTMDEFIQRIMAWVQRKGIGSLKTKSGNASGSANSLDAMQQAAYAIAINILQNGIKPQPFLFPAYEKNRKLLIENLKKLLDA